MTPKPADQRLLDELARGNFTIAVPQTKRRDEVGQISESMRMMADKVRSTIAEVKASAREVTNASVEISGATTSSRSIINTRDEPHADAERYRRLRTRIREKGLPTLLAEG